MKRFYETEDLETEIFGAEVGEAQEDAGLTDLNRLLENEDEALPALELELELTDGQSLACEALGVFGAGERQYIALHPKEDEKGIIHILRLEEGENDEAKLLPVEEDEELEAAARAFYQLIDGRDWDGTWAEDKRKEDAEDDRD